MKLTNTCGFCKVYCGNAWCISVESKGLGMIDDMKYFDDEWGMSPYGENKVLFLAEYLALRGFPYVWRRRVEICIESYRKDGKWVTRGEEDLSHDNFTAIVCLSVKYGLDYHKDVLRRDLVHCMLHPRDAVFYISRCERWYGVIGKLLYPIALLAQIHSCATTYKERNGQKMLKTDGKLLTWLRCKSFKLSITSFICTKIINMKRDFGSWKNCFSIYFKDLNHPINNMEEENYEL